MSTPTARSALHLKVKRRPSSAIFVGISPVPDLPEPPSPGGTTSSGLPSPPATNSTGSGSTGDVGSTYMGSTRQRPTELDNDHSSFSYDQDYDNDHDIEEDDTARLDHRQPSSETSENILALQRVKSLTQRNRMVLDKLNRLSSPSPGPSNRSNRSSNAPSSSSASSSSSTKSRARLSATHSRAFSTASIPSTQQPLTRTSLNSLSGSETERESNYSSHPYSASSNQYASSNEDLSPLQPSGHRPTTPSRTRLRSAPSSPAKALTRTARRSSPGPGAKTTLKDVYTPEESFSSASKRTRQPLPREFRDSRFAMEPVTPHREAPSPAPSNRSSASQSFNRSPRAPRFSTVRDVGKRHQSRWVSEDMSNASIREDDDSPSGRLQSTRGGSAESGLTAIASAGGRLVGESLRAAGISMRRDDEGEVFTNPRRRLVDFDRSSSRLEDRKERDTDATYGRRAATSMADYHTRSRPDDDDDDDDIGPRTAPLRTYKSAYGLLDKDRAGSSMGRYASPHAASTPALNRVESNAYGSRRFAGNPLITPGPPGGSTTHVQDGSEHTRLMNESLSMFESQLSRLSNGSSPASVETFKNAQSLVTVADRLNSLLRAASTRSLDEQVNAELGEADGEPDAVERAAIWRAVGGEYREQLRASDELVRGLTGLLLGIGKIIKESSGVVNDNAHERSESTGNDAYRRMMNTSPEAVSGGGGGRLAEVRRSWEPSPGSQRLMGRVDSILSGKNRPSSSGGRFDSKPTPNHPTTSLSRDVSTPGDPSTGTTSSTHIRGNDPRVGFRADYEPSPTPASRNTTHHDRSQTLPALAIPPSLPALPSEDPQSSLRRAKTTATPQNVGSVRRFKTNNPIVPTIRGSPISLSITNPTTALTPHHVQNSPAVSTSNNPQAFPMTRNDSKLSLSSAGSSTKVTFSKPSTVSAMLNGLSERDRKRTVSSSSNEAPVKVSLPITPVSGSEAERDRRKTIGLNSKTLRKSVDGLNATNTGSQSRREPPQREGTAAPVLPYRKERRRTITEIFS